VNDDPLQGHVLAPWLPPRHPSRRVEREPVDRVVGEGPDATVEIYQLVRVVLL